MTMLRIAITALLPLAALPACQYDENNLCGDNQEYVAEVDHCRCVDNAVKEDGMCRLCPAGEVVVDNACACPDGFVRDETGACVEKPDALGLECDGDSACGADYPFCQIADGATLGYCTTQGCVSSDDCTGGYTCAVWATEATYCMRPPTGLGEACSSQSDCAEFESDVCGAPLANICMPSGCDLALDDCPDGYSCCDVTCLDPTAPLLCVPEGGCPC